MCKINEKKRLFALCTLSRQPSKTKNKQVEFRLIYGKYLYYAVSSSTTNAQRYTPFPAFLGRRKLSSSRPIFLTLLCNVHRQIAPHPQLVLLLKKNSSLVTSSDVPLPRVKKSRKADLQLSRHISLYVYISSLSEAYALCGRCSVQLLFWEKKLPRRVPRELARTEEKRYFKASGKR